MTLSHKQFSIWFLRIASAVLLTVVIFQLWLDPFWIWRRCPPWLGWHTGHNWNLDVRMRSAKPLQLLSRRPDIVFLGSSRVYRGFDLSNHPVHRYNHGISGLRIHEMEGFLRQILHLHRPDILVIGLDYFMFDARFKTMPGYNPAIAKFSYMLDAIPEAFFSIDSMEGAWLAVSGDISRNGAWHYNGYKDMLPVDHKRIAQVIAKNFPEILSNVEPDPAGYKALGRILAIAKQSGVRMKLYLSPMHPEQFRHLRETGGFDKYSTWKTTVAGIVESETVPFYDFSDATFGDEAELLEKGSTRHWQDPSHFSPLVGHWILEQMGVEDRIEANRQ